MNDNLRLGRIGGVKIGANWSLFALAALVAYFLATSRLPADVPGYSQSAYWLAGALTAVLLVVGVLLHEMAHAVVARHARLKVDGITLWFMGGVTRIEGEDVKPSVELSVALVGPLASALVGAVSAGLSVLASNAGWALAAASLRWLALISVLLAGFNLLPASPLDGGKVMHGALWGITHNRWLATRITAGAGIALGALCAGFGLMVFTKGDQPDGLVLLLMAWFLMSSAKREQLAGRAQYVLGNVHVSDIMRPAVIAPGWLTVSSFWANWVARYPEAAFVLERWDGQGLVGVVTAHQLAAVPPGLQGSMRAQDVAFPLPSTAQPALSPADPALAVAGRGGIALPVWEGPAIVGVVLVPDILAMVNRGTPVEHRTWASFRPATSPTWPA
ncbi:MAG: site-2 protease family protein [Acidimicrobiales bacterium]